MLKYLFTGFTAACLLGASACSQSPSSSGAGDDPNLAPPQHLSNAQPPAPDQPNSPTPVTSNSAQPSQPGSDFPRVPDGALYTIYCLNIDTPTHVPDANHLKEQLIAKTNSHDWYVVHSENSSALYYGFYKTFDDDSQPQEKKRAQDDRHLIAALQDNQGNCPFATCGFQPLNSPDPAAPPDWDLRNANGFWSVQVAAYVGSPLRKQYAVDAVRQFREHGIPAYFYHGASVSSICIGAWPREAVKEQEAADAQSDAPNRHIMVLPQPLPKGARTDNIYAPDGEKVKVLAPRIEPVDPSLIATLRDYPTNDVNGETRFHKVQTPQGPEEDPDPSFLVMIPQKDDQANGSNTADASGAPTLPALGLGGADTSGGSSGTDPNAGQQVMPTPNPLEPGGVQPGSAAPSNGN